jgi:Holliday junction resolvasome RuvABC endonuclease subunit
VKTLALDLSTKSGWSVFEDGIRISSGVLDKVFVKDFNVNDEPGKSPLFPYNVIDAADTVCRMVMNLIGEHQPDALVIEQTTMGRNRFTQKLLEWIHFAFLKQIGGKMPLHFIDVSEWRKLVEMRLSVEEKRNNRDVSQGKKRGKVTKKHLAVNMVNAKYGLGLKIKDNDQADAILMNLAFHIKRESASATQV